MKNEFIYSFSLLLVMTIKDFKTSRGNATKRHGWQNVALQRGNEIWQPTSVLKYIQQFTATFEYLEQKKCFGLNAASWHTWHIYPVTDLLHYLFCSLFAQLRGKISATTLSLGVYRSRVFFCLYCRIASPVASLLIIFAQFCLEMSNRLENKYFINLHWDDVFLN